MQPELEGWRSVEVRGADGAIDSDERVTASRPVVQWSEEGARRLGDRYWLEVTRAGRGMVRLRQQPDGFELRLFGVGPCLLRFGSAETAHNRNQVSCRYPILRGLLARRAGGAVVMTQTGRDEPELRAAVTGFVPRFGLRPGFPPWSGAIYEQVERRLHLEISRRYFRRLIDGAAS